MKNFIARVLLFIGKIFGVINRLSDGYHTFQELYSHRFALFAALASIYRDDAWKSLKDSAGREIEGWFIAGIFTKTGMQISYHLPIKYWDYFNFAKEYDSAPWDGHTSEEAAKRLWALASDIIVGDEISSRISELRSRPTEVNSAALALKSTALDSLVKEDKAARVALDEVLQFLKKSGQSRERSLAITNIQQGIMWLGMDLKALGQGNPYPNSYNPENNIVEPTVDGLKM